MIKNNPNVDGTTYTGPDGDEMIESTPRRQRTPSSQRTARSNSIENGASSQSSAASRSAPTDGARGASESEETPKKKKPTTKEIEAAVDERLCDTDEQYKADKEKLELLEKVNKGFALIDSSQGWRDDAIVEGWDLPAIIDNPSAPAAAKEAARILLSHPDLWKELARSNVSDDRATFDDLKKMIEDLRTKQKGKKDAIRAEVKAELYEAAGLKSDGSAATGGSSTGTTEPPKDKAASLNEPPFVQPPLSSKTGLEGAAENINNTLTAISEASHKISIELANPNLDPNDKAKLQNRFNDLQLLQQMLTAMYTQIQQAMSNLMKMYSDAAANAVRNMR